MGTAGVRPIAAGHALVLGAGHPDRNFYRAETRGILELGGGGDAGSPQGPPPGSLGCATLLIPARWLVDLAVLEDPALSKSLGAGRGCRRVSGGKGCCLGLVARNPVPLFGARRPQLRGLDDRSG